MTVPVLHLSLRPQWFEDADQAPPTRTPRHPGQHRTAVSAWQQVTSEGVLDRRHLLLPDPTDGGELVSFALVEHSPYWAGWEIAADVRPIWSGPVVYAPTPYAAYGGVGLASFDTAGLVIRYGLEQARSWGAQALVLPHLTPDIAATAAAAETPHANLFANFSYTTEVTGGASAHLAGMANRRAARSLGREVRRAHDAGLRVRIRQGSDLERELPAFIKLTQQVDAKHGTTKFGADVLIALASVPGTVLLAAEHDDGMVGAFLAHSGGDALYLSTCGLNYARLRELHTYTALMAASLDYATQIGVRTVDAGRSNHSVKRRWAMNPSELRTLVYLTEPTDSDTATALAEMGQLLAKAAGGTPDTTPRTIPYLLRSPR